MMPFSELNKQNHELTELCQVLTVLIDDRGMCDSGVTCELFQRFADRFREHMDLEDRSLYSNLLVHKDKSVNSAALRSLNSSKELKRLFSSYMHRWCRKGALHIDTHAHGEFVKDTKQMFGFILERIQDETEELYPLCRSLTDAPSTTATHA